jgi:hypothetical protein
MKIYRTVILLVDAALGLAAAILLLLWAGGRIDVTDVLNNNPTLPWAGIRISVLTIGAALVGANLLMLLFALLLMRDHTIEAPIDGGKVSVSISAVEQSLARTACALPDVRDVHVRVRRRSGKPNSLRIRADYTAWEGTAVRETTRRLQEVLRLRLQDIVGADVPLVFDINLAGIILKETKKPDEKRKKDKDKNRPGQPYGGPVYPIDESI